MRHIFSLLAAAAIMAALLIPSLANAQEGPHECEDSTLEFCAGAAGTGGEKSEGNAQGFREVGPGKTEGATFTNTGNADAGHVELTGTVEGSRSGTCRDGTERGHSTGVFGDSSGQRPC